MSATIQSIVVYGATAPAVARLLELRAVVVGWRNARSLRQATSLLQIGSITTVPGILGVMVTSLQEAAVLAPALLSQAMTGWTSELVQTVGEL